MRFLIQRNRILSESLCKVLEVRMIHEIIERIAGGYNYREAGVSLRRWEGEPGDIGKHGCQLGNVDQLL